MFGADRCMFESNYPLEKMGTNYTALWNTFKRTAYHASDHERGDLFGGTANRAYRLGCEPAWQFAPVSGVIDVKKWL